MRSTYYLYEVKTQFMQFYNYSYLGIDKATNEAFIIDPSWDISEVLQILEKHEAKLKKVLLTHSHFDHTNMVKRLINLFDVEVYMSEKEVEYYRYKCRNLKVIEDLDVIEVGETRIKCLVTPGHTVGSTCYWGEDNLFSGDTIFIEGCGMCNTQGGSAERMYYSINRLSELIPSDVLVYPGHSYGEEPGKSMDFLKRRNIYFQIDDINQFVKYRNRKNNIGIFNFK